MNKSIRSWFCCGWLQLALALCALAGLAADRVQSQAGIPSAETPGRSLHRTFFARNSDAPQSPSVYTKLSDGGKALPDTAVSWIMVKDNATGLVWEVKGNMDGASHYDDPNDADNTYTWYDSNPETNGGHAGTFGSGTDTESFIRAMNQNRFGGFSDWRLPTIKELANLVHSGSTDPSINTHYFPNTVSSWYWSSSTSANYTYHAWGVGFRHGYDSYNHKYLHGHVRAVRGEPQTG